MTKSALGVLLAAAALLGCASVESKKVGDGAYSIACTQRHEACTREADVLCGQGNYAVVKDTTLDYCYSTESSNTPCQWRVIVECASSPPPTPLPR